MKILIQKKWRTNIGEELLAKGCRATLERAFPEADIYESSSWGRKLTDMKKNGGIKNYVRNALGMSIKKWETMERNRISIHTLHDVDLVVIPGPSLYPAAFNRIETGLTEKTPTLLLGSGAPTYDDETIRCTRELLEEKSIDAVVTRNHKAYDAYSDLFDHSYDGIDNGFFISDWFQPDRTRKELTVLTFDKSEEPSDITPQGKVIRPHHTPFSLLYPFFLEKFMNTGWSKNWLKQDNWFASDTLEDYLFIYANASVTHTDRLHACIPTITYGNQARFYKETPRTGTFDKEFIEREDGFLTVDVETMEVRKRQQVNVLQDMVNEIV